MEILPLYGHINLVANRSFVGLLTRGKLYKLSQIVQMKSGRNTVVAKAYVVMDDSGDFQAYPPHYFERKKE